MADVKYAPKLTFGTGAVQEGVGINVPRMREERAAKAKQVLKKNGIPALLVTGSNNVRYLVGFCWSEFQPSLSYTLFFAEHDPVVFAHAGAYQQMYDQACEKSQMPKDSKDYCTMCGRQWCSVRINREIQTLNLKSQK